MATSARMTQQSFWAITPYFNPVGYHRRLENFHTFRRYLTVPLVAVELAHDGPFQLQPSDADVLIQRRGGDILWQKERLLNIALEALPSHCDKVAWLDCDVVFDRDDWPEQAAKALDHFPVIQPFHHVHESVEHSPPLADAADRPHPPGHSFAWLLSTGEMPAGILRGNMRVIHKCNSGLAWAARRELLDACSFYDACVMGSGNRAIACAALGRFNDAIDYLQMNPRWTHHYLTWARTHFNLVHGAIGCVEGAIYHLWHGDLHQRRYQERHQAFRVFEFDPSSDIALADNGCWKWASQKPQMHAYARNYFASRHEDG